MQIIKAISVGLSFIFFFTTSSVAKPTQGTEGQALIALAQSQQVAEFKFAQQQGAEVSITPDGKSFYVFWKPENYTDKTPILVSLHGHGSWSVRDFQIWHPYLKSRGYAFIGMQWWKGTGEKTSDYLKPEEIYRAIDQIFREKKLHAPALLHGFSRGSANSYAVAALDATTGNRYFDLFIANAGKANQGYPPNQAIQDGIMGPSPLSGTRWITVAGGKDPNPERDGILGMRESQKWIKRYGGEAVLAIEDPNGNHGVFHRNPKNVYQALDKFEELIKA